jgi:NDP-sugar pyrophosphorylase family protein
MRAILLAGGQGTRLRPLTLATPKPIVPVFDRPFLEYQIDLVRQVPDIREVVLSLNYQPEKIEAVFGDGSRFGVRIRYVVEPVPLGTGGAIKFAAGSHRDGPLVVLNGDVFTSVNLQAVIDLHRERRSRATIVLTPVENPSAYGLVETDSSGNVLAFREKPEAGAAIRDATINAGIYVLEPETLDRIPDGVPYSIERGYFPSLVERGETFVAHVSRGYWIDIGTPDKYREAHRDIMDGRFAADPFGTAPGRTIVAPTARVAPDAVIEAPCFIGHDVVVEPGVRLAPYTVLSRGTRVGENASLDGAIVWPDSRIGEHSVVGKAIVGREAAIGSRVRIGDERLVGDRTIVTDYSHL